MFKIGGDELWVNQVRGAIPIEVTFHNHLEFIEGFTVSIPFYFCADHWDLFGLWGVSIYIKVLNPVVRFSVCGRITIYLSKWEGVLVKVMGFKVL